MAVLPTEFSDLEAYAEKWALATEGERYAQRLSSTMEEMQAFYDAIFPRVEAALEYLDQFPLDDMPEDAVRLLQMIYSFVNVGYPVELWRQPNVPDSGATSLDRVIEPLP